MSGIVRDAGMASHAWDCSCRMCGALEREDEDSDDGYQRTKAEDASREVCVLE